jgi:Na+/proline symporter
MTGIDWVVLAGTLGFIVVYGILKTRKLVGMEGYLLGGNEAKWWTIGLSVMATQASAITFLSTPGQAFHSGMGFVQFYFGLPLAMIVICVTFIPIFKRLKVYTAYEFLEKRFDLKTRSLSAILFLVQRGLAAGITIYAPAIILSTIIGWNLNYTILVIGTLVILYTVSGGTKAVSATQKQQMYIIMGGMIIAFITILKLLPENVGFIDALSLAAQNDKMDILDFEFDLDNRYNIWSGLIGGFFVALAYFGTDQSQVQRYISSKSIRESQMGLVFNGLLKVPLQFFILLTGVMVFVFYQFNQSPIFFNNAAVDEVYESENGDAYRAIEAEYSILQSEKHILSQSIVDWNSNNTASSSSLTASLANLRKRESVLKERAVEIIESTNEKLETNDKDYVFIHFILNHLPKGLVGLLIAVILSAAMSSTASELNALGSTSAVDIYKRNIKPGQNEDHYVKASKLLTLMWGIIAIIFAIFGTLAENLIQLVNIVGSIFYGTLLGIFVVAFYFKRIRGNAVFFAAIVSQISVIIIFLMDIISYLWLNVIGCFITVILAFLINSIENSKPIKMKT